jgi:hypothetical protein
MAQFTEKTAAMAALADLSKRLKISADDIAVISVHDADFPDMALGIPVSGEVAGQMIVSGWRIILSVADANYEYRASESQLRLRGFEGRNVLVEA